MRKWVIPLFVGIIIGCIIGIVLGLFVLEILNITPDGDVKYGVLEIVYFLVAPIGVFATLLAVAVALWGNELKSYLFREKCMSSVPNSFSEVLKDEDDDNPEASRYECNLSIKNTSSREISECCLFLLEAHFKESDNAKYRNISPQNRVPIFWKYPNDKQRNIAADETVSITLFKIHPDESQSRFDGSEATSVPRHLSIVGLRGINPKYTRKGSWKLIYCVSNSHREIERFEVIITWTGEWKSREKEMDNEATIEMKRINR